MGQQLKMSAAEFKARTTTTPAGQRQFSSAPSRPAPQVQPTGNLYAGVRPVMLVGLDPGVATGFALWHARQGATPGRFLEVNTLTFWQAVRRIEKLVREFGPAAIRVRVENPNGNRPTFDKDVAGAKRREKIAQNVGSNKRDAQLLIGLCEDLGIPYDAIVPQAKGGPAGKIGMEHFKGAPGFPAKCSQHARDASALVIGL